MSQSRPIVAFDRVSKAYGDAGRPQPVLEAASFEVEEGQIVAILGRSGSGKSTLLNLVAGIDAPDAGSVLVDGRAIERLDERDRTLFRRRNIGFVYQFFNLIPTLSLRENVRLPLELQGSPEADDRALDMLERVGLAGRSDDFPDRLSGGEQQRVAIARALAGRPRIILADEPTGNLDVEIGGRILELLLEMARDGGRTLLMVTHSRQVAATADRILRVEQHRVLEGAG